MTENAPVLVIDLQAPEAECHRCGAATPLKWGLPIDDSGRIVPTWFQGEWGGVPACKPCYDWHQAASDRIRPLEAPLA